MWLYAESLRSDLGVYKDPYSRFGRLESERFRAVRLVVDTGLHAYGWTRATLSITSKRTRRLPR